MRFVVITSTLVILFLLAIILVFSTKANRENSRLQSEGDSITVNKTNYDFGTVKESGGVVNATFIVKNNMKDAVLLTYVSTSCGCTAPNWTKDPIEPCKTGKVTATYNPKGRFGPFDKSITISTTGNPERITVRIKGLVK
jgi:hypothetical protein